MSDKNEKSGQEMAVENIAVPDLIDDLLKKTGKLTIAKQIELALPQIEKARAMGFTDKQIVEWLAEQGLPIKLSTFRGVLARLRMRHIKQEKQEKKRQPSVRKEMATVEVVEKQNPNPSSGLSISKRELEKIADKYEPIGGKTNPIFQKLQQQQEK